MPLRLGFLNPFCHSGLPDAKNAADRIWLTEILSDNDSFYLFSTSSQTHISPVSRYQYNLCHYSWGWVKKKITVVDQISVVANIWVFSTCSRQIYSHILEHNMIYIYLQYITIFFLLCIHFKTYKQHMDSRCRAHHKETLNHLRSCLQFVHCHLLPGFSNHNQTTLLMQQSQTHKGNAFAILYLKCMSIA